MEGLAAVIVAVTGAVVSLISVYRQGKKQDKGNGECQERLEAVIGQLGDMAVELAEVKRENNQLKVEIATLKGRFGG